MTAAQSLWLTGILLRIAAEKSTQTVSEWCTENLIFDEPDCRGPFSLAGREYLRDICDDWGITEVTDQVRVMGPRTGKTRTSFAGTAWTVVHAPCRMLRVMPKVKGAAGTDDCATTRFIPMLRRTPCIAKLIPSGAHRHQFKAPQQMLGGMIIDWAGSNSVASLASNPCRIVDQDEVEKFNATRKRDEEGNVVEADASALADERCREYANPKRFKNSTPTLVGGKVWEELTKKSDFRRYFLPCPYCSKTVLLAWSSEFTVLPKLGCEAWMKWDQAAKRDDGSWDLDAVEKSAHYECPHCKGKIKDQHKPGMIAAGKWVATRQGSKGYRGYHLPSLYAIHAQCNCGALAKRFLEACNSLDGPRAFINNDLAEPYASQGTGGKRIEEVGKIEVGAEWKKLLTVDCQQKAPHFWFVKRAYGGKEIVGVQCGSCETWDDVRAVQGVDVADAGVIIDSGYGAKDDAEVYRTCAQYGELLRDDTKGKLLHIGWMPAKGMPGRRRWRDPNTQLMVPWYYRATDPFMGTDRAGEVSMDVFEFAAEHFKDILDRLRRNKDPRYHWTIDAAMNTDEYHEHMRNQVKKEVIKFGRPVIEWSRRHRYAPDHLFACETMQVAGGFAFELLQLKDMETKEAKND